MQKHVTDYVLYRWRYAFGYTFAILLIGILLTIASLYVPGGLREAEMQSSIQSGSLSIESIEPHMVIDLPYHIMQRIGFNLFGISTFTIKLPSIILGTLTCVGVFLLTRTWFRRNVAILATILAVTTTHFLFLSQDGTPGIMYSFLAIWILFTATYVTRNKLFGTLWKVLAGVFMATILYTPFGIYLVIAVMTTAFFHPHIRYIITRFNRPRLALAVALGLISITPLIYASIVDQTTLFTLLGIPTGDISLKENVVKTLTDVFGFMGTSNDATLRPLYSLGVVLLAAVGMYKLLTYKYTARSYITLTWGLLTVPLILLNPERITYIFPLVILMLALGIATLITDWYKLFPRNPYARIAGLIPLTILVLGLVASGVVRYMYNYQHNPEVLSHYSHDLRLLDEELGESYANPKSTRVVVTSSELGFYNLVAHYDERFAASTDIVNAPVNVIYSRQAYIANKPAVDKVDRIITNWRATDGDRFYIYKTAAK